jgi:hypothetical protein
MGCSPQSQRRDDRLEDILLADREADRVEVWLSHAKQAAGTEVLETMSAVRHHRLGASGHILNDIDGRTSPVFSKRVFIY